MRGKLTQQYSAEDAAGLREHLRTADSSSVIIDQPVQPRSLPQTTALDRQISRGAYAPVASSVRRNDNVAKEDSDSAMLSNSLYSQGFSLSGPGWTIPIRLKGCPYTLPNKGATTAGSLDKVNLQQCQAQCQGGTAQAEVNEAASECSSYQSTANTLQLSGQGWAMPVRMHGTINEAAKLPRKAGDAPKQAIAIKPEIHGGSAQEPLNSQGVTADTGCEYRIQAPVTLHISPASQVLHNVGCTDNAGRIVDLLSAAAALSPRECIQLLERTCSGSSLPLPGLASPAKQYPRLCPLTRSAPCVTIRGSPSGHQPGSASPAPSTQSATHCDLQHTIAKQADAGEGVCSAYGSLASSLKSFLQHAAMLQYQASRVYKMLKSGRCNTEGSSGAAGKLLAPPVPYDCTSNSPAYRETGPASFIGAGRDLSDRASECRHAPDQLASEVDSDSQRGASSIEGQLPFQPDVDSSSQHDMDSSSQRPLFGACSSADEPQREESRHSLRQHSSGSSVYNTPQMSLSSVSQASTAGSALEKRESNPLYACSSSGASSGIRGGQANPYYACSTSSASSGSALPQRQPFWPHAAHAAPAASSMLSFTAQSIPEDAASEVQRLIPPAT